MTAISAWIEPGNMITSDCWAASGDIDAQGYTHHTIAFWHTRIPSKARGVVSKRTSTHTTCRETTLSPCPLHIRIEIQESKFPPFHILVPDRLGHG